jgi:hypothetical protein
MTYKSLGHLQWLIKNWTQSIIPITRCYTLHIYLDPGRLAAHIQQAGSSPQTMFSALAESMKHFAPLRLSNPKLCREHTKD